MGNIDQRAQRDRREDLQRAFERRTRHQATPLTMQLGKVINFGAKPASNDHFVACNPVLSIGGTEAERATPSYVVDTARWFFVDVIGSHVPAVGDILRCFAVGDRWVAERRTGGGGPITVTIPGCLCAATPTTLHMTSTNHAANGGMFQDGTLVYGPTPAAYAVLVLGPNSFLSVDSYIDGDTGDSFRYYFTCNTSLYSLTRVYLTSLYGSPFKDTVRWIWLIGGAGNTCTPYSMAGGVGFIGVDPSVNVVITG